MVASFGSIPHRLRRTLAWIVWFWFFCSPGVTLAQTVPTGRPELATMGREVASPTEGTARQSIPLELPSLPNEAAISESTSVPLNRPSSAIPTTEVNKDVSSKKEPSASPPGATASDEWWKRVPNARPLPWLGGFIIPPSGPGYYSFFDWLRGEYREQPPKYPLVVRSVYGCCRRMIGTFVTSTIPTIRNLLGQTR